MRTLILILLFLLLVAGGLVGWVVLTTPRTAEPLTFPLREAERRLLAHVPADAESFALIPSIVVVHGKLMANGVTRGPVEQWTARQEVPPPWVVGGAGGVIWKRGDAIGYAIALDPVRAALTRLWLLTQGGHPVSWEGSTLLVNASPGNRFDLSALDAIASGLPPSDALAVHAQGDDRSFPPIGRPAVSAVTIGPNEIAITSRAAGPEAPAPARLPAQFPAGAMLAASFASPPGVLRDLERLLGADVAGLAAEGGMIALYDLERGTLLPRPRVVIAVPAAPASRAAVAELRGPVELVGETREAGGEILVAFDRRSVGSYQSDRRIPSTLEGGNWAVRIDAPRLMPALAALDKPALRFIAPRVYRNSRNLKRWIGALGEAEVIEAAGSGGGGVEELRVRITSK